MAVCTQKDSWLSKQGANLSSPSHSVSLSLFLSPSVSLCDSLCHTGHTQDSTPFLPDTYQTSEDAQRPCVPTLLDTSHHEHSEILGGLFFLEKHASWKDNLEAWLGGWSTRSLSKTRRHRWVSPFSSTHWTASFPLCRRRCPIARKKANWPESRMLSRSSPHPITGKNPW